jgi:hypothetical protein
MMIMPLSDHDPGPSPGSLAHVATASHASK